MAKIIVGLMDTADEAHRVVRELIENGFERSSIGLMANDQKDESSPSPELGIDSEAGSGALKGAGAGAAFGGIAGLLVSIAAIPIPGVGPIIAAGPIAAALAGASVGAVAGTGIGALTTMGVSEEQAQYYTEGVRRGGTLVTVSAPNEPMAELAANIMRAHCAVNIDERANQWKTSGWAGYAASNDETLSGSLNSRQSGEPYSAIQQRMDEQVLPVAEEELQVRDRQAWLEDAALASQVPETPLEETLRMHETNANAQRIRNNIAATSMASNYGGPERRRNVDSFYVGIERRAA